LLQTDTFPELYKYTKNVFADGARPQMHVYRTHVHVRYMLSPSLCLSVICLSVTLVRPTQAIEIFGNVSMHIWYLSQPLTSTDGDRPRGTSPSGRGLEA